MRAHDEYIKDNGSCLWRLNFPLLLIVQISSANKNKIDVRAVDILTFYIADTHIAIKVPFNAESLFQWPLNSIGISLDSSKKKENIWLIIEK